MNRRWPPPAGTASICCRACRVNCSPIWGLSLAPGLTAACTAVIERSREHVAATDDEATEHEMWRVDDESALRSIATLVAPEPVVIADGHHRHETADRYRAECPARHADTPDGCDSIMAFVAELAPAELALHAIHRLVSGLPDGFDLLGALARCFRLEPVTADLDALTGQMATRGTAALVTACGAWLLLPRTDEPARRGAPDSRRVDAALAALPPHRTDHEHGTGRCLDAVRAGPRPGRRARAAGDGRSARRDGARGRENAAEVDVFPPETPHRLRLPPARPLRVLPPVASQATVQVVPDRKSAARSPPPFCRATSAI